MVHITQCIFCRIIAGEVPAYKVYEDEHVVCILDRLQAVEGHTLVIPKTHFENIFVMPDDFSSLIMRATKKISLLLRERLSCQGVNVVNANGVAAQQSVFHFHMHVIPRWDNDGEDAWGTYKEKSVDIEQVFKKIKSD